MASSPPPGPPPSSPSACRHHCASSPSSVRQRRDARNRDAHRAPPRDPPTGPSTATPATDRRRWSLDSPAQLPSRRHRVKPRIVTVSTVEATDASTMRSTFSPSLGSNATQQPAPTCHADSRKARPNEKSSAASSATSHDESGDSSSTNHPQHSPLDRHRSVALLEPLSHSRYRFEAVMCAASSSAREPRTQHVHVIAATVQAPPVGVSSSKAWGGRRTSSTMLTRAIHAGMTYTVGVAMLTLTSSTTPTT